jgi:hypothetical protein
MPYFCWTLVPPPSGTLPPLITAPFPPMIALTARLPQIARLSPRTSQPTRRQLAARHRLHSLLQRCRFVAKNEARSPSEARSGLGHEDRFRPTGPNVGCRFGQATFGGMESKEKDSPIPAVPISTK